MTTAFILSICVLLLLAYFFDLTASITKIPSVILLLLLGWLAQQTCYFFDIKMPNLEILLPILGTVGLILIVLDGALELQLNKERIPIVKSSFWMAILSMAFMAIVFTVFIKYTQDTTFKIALTNIIPMCIISSAVAIPTVKSFSKYTKEFVIYESSFSDIIGVLFFNFMALNAVINFTSVGMFIIQFILIIVVSFFSILGLSFLLNKIDHHIKYMPIILIVILIYTISKSFHLPALLFILLFGLFLGNIDELNRFQFLQILKPDSLKNEINKFKEIVIEATFLIRALFFILFGFLIHTDEVFNSDTIYWSIGIVFSIFVIRYLFMKLLKIPSDNNILYVAPRGLITVLLILSMDKESSLYFVNNSLLIQVILLSSLFMMFGLMFSKKDVATE